LPQLKQLIEETHPVAIFAFGMGGTDAFSLESRASNRRGNGHDNNNQQAPQPSIVADGPEEYQATANLAQLSAKLKKQGHTVRISKWAGAYLCEEALYSLEHLRATHDP